MARARVHRLSARVLHEALVRVATTHPRERARWRHRSEPQWPPDRSRAGQLLVSAAAKTGDAGHGRLLAQTVSPVWPSKAGYPVADRLDLHTPARCIHGRTLSPTLESSLGAGR